MALYFDKVELLSYQHTPIILGAGLRFRINKKLTIKGFLIEKTSNEPAQALFEKENNIIRLATDYDDILLEGISFGQGKISNIDFEGGVMARSEKYTYEIECYEDGNLFNATDGVYTGLAWASARQIETIDETFEYSDSEDGDKTYTHNFSVRYREYTSEAQGIALAKAIASNFFNSTSGLGSYLNSYVDLGGKKRFYTETYNIIDCSCSIQETIIVPKVSAGNYSYGLSYQMDQDADGFVNITETVDIKGLTKPPMAGAEEGYLALKAAAYTRSNVVYAAYNFSNSTLFNQPISKSQAKNPFLGTISFSTTFTNNPKYQNFAIWERTLELSLNQDNYYTVSENGSIQGIGRPTLDKYINALNFYNTNVKSPSVDNRLDDLYDTTGRTYTLYLISHQFSKNEIDGVIQYSVTKTDDDRFSTGNIKKTETEISISNPVHLIQKYEVFNFKEIIQGQQTSTLGQQNISISMNGKRGTELDEYLINAKAIASANSPATSDKYIESVNYSLSPQQNTFSFDITFIFVGTHKALADLTIT